MRCNKKKELVPFEKIDTTENGDKDKLISLIGKCQKRDARRVPLILNGHTTILVRPENNNKEYAEKKRKELEL